MKGDFDNCNIGVSKPTTIRCATDDFDEESRSRFSSHNNKLATVRSTLVFAHFVHLVAFRLPFCIQKFYDLDLDAFWVNLIIHLRAQKDCL